MGSNFYTPKWQPPPEEPKAPAEGNSAYEGPTDFHSLRQEADPGFGPLVTELAPKKPAQRTDFVSLGGRQSLRPQSHVPRTAVDWLVDGLTPCLIFFLVLPVLLFLLDVRYIYTEVHDANLRWVTLCYLVGIVGINRLVARDGTEESFLYAAALAGAIGFYTLATTEMYGVGSVTRNFMNSNAYAATGFNMLVAAFLWWMVNRLTHECCVDENTMAGDVGMFTGTLQRFQKSMRTKEEKKPKGAKFKSRSLLDDVRSPFLELEAYDPHSYQRQTGPAQPKPNYAALSNRLAKRHPGISIFYFSVPAFAIFTLGLRVTQHGGESMIRYGWIYLLAYTTAALMLLLTTSLGGLREYYRSKKLAMPGGVGWFWLGLGVTMVAMVVLGALQLPLPSLPPMAAVDEHEYDPWNRGPANERFQLKEVESDPLVLFEEAQYLDQLGKGVLVLFGLFLFYGLIKALAALFAALARQRATLPKALTRFFDRAERLLSKLTKLPAIAPRRRRIRIQRDIATSARYSNPAGDPQRSTGMTARDHVEYAYEALCALAYDLGVPRETAQTPQEFLAAFPAELKPLRAEAEELTRLYILAAYSSLPLDDRVMDRVRKFWVRYVPMRNQVVK